MASGIASKKPQPRRGRKSEGFFSGLLDSLRWEIARSYLLDQIRGSGVNSVVARAIAGSIKRAGYITTLEVDNDTQGELPAPLLDVLKLRSAELRSFTVALMLLATASLHPVLRLNPRLNRLRGELVNIGNCARGNGPHRNSKLNKLVPLLAERMKTEIGGDVFSELRGQASSIESAVLVTDLPIEWIEFDGLPYCIRHDTSRIPVLPGNLMFKVCSDGDQAVVPFEAVTRILVVRSFAANDPIREVLQRTLSDRFETKIDIQVKFVDVATDDEFVEAVNNCEGAVLIFDGHGAVDSENGVGALVIGDSRIDTWSLKGRIRFPPIVLLSACDTFPLDGSHGSTAIAMLALGAKTVLGTLLPIDAVRSALFLKRLILRIAEFLPLLMSAWPGGVEWRALMSGMLRMSYATEVIWAVFDRFDSTNREAYQRVSLSANLEINERDPRWFRKLISRLAATFNQQPKHLLAVVRRECGLTDTLKYVQLGRSELISVIRGRAGAMP